MLNSIYARSNLGQFRTATRILKTSNAKSDRESYEDNEQNKRLRIARAWGVCCGTKLNIFV
jgi:hypothetical protein